MTTRQQRRAAERQGWKSFRTRMRSKTPEEVTRAIDREIMRMANGDSAWEQPMPDEIIRDLHAFDVKIEATISNSSGAFKEALAPRSNPSPAEERYHV